jgi:predicted  nucleic acid-binding Zn-ribbon protein
MVIITLVFWFVRTGNRQLIERIEELDDEISRRMKEEHRLRTQLEKKEDDNLALKQQINQHKEQEGQLRDKLGKLENTLKNSTYKEERKKLNAEIKMLKEEINKIKVENINLENKLHQSELETSLLQKELSNIEQGNNSLVQEKRNLDANIEKTMSIKRRILKVLLKNPDIKKKALKRINPNKHHSKKFVQQLGDRIKENAHVSGLVQTVDSCRYNPKKRGHVVVTRNNDKHAYALQVFAKGDEGFGAEILLYAENQWQAVIEAKCIVEAISMLDGYTVEVRAS